MWEGGRGDLSFFARLQWNLAINRDEKGTTKGKKI